MVMDIKNVRRDAAHRARKKAKGIRIVPSSSECPCDWRPTTVANPKTGEPFTFDQAWHFIADCLDAGEEMEPTILDTPFGKNAQGYVLLVQVGDRKIYIKLQLGSSTIIGRSFHYSIHP